MGMANRCLQHLLEESTLCLSVRRGLFISEFGTFIWYTLRRNAFSQCASSEMQILGSIQQDRKM